VGRRAARDNGRSTETNGQHGLTSSTEWHILVTKITYPHKRATTVAPSLPHNPGGPMPNFAQFVSFFDKGFTVPPEKTVTDHPPPHHPPIPGIPNMADLNKDRDGFLAFKYRTVSGSGTLSVKLNGVQFNGIPFGSSDSVVARVWYETIDGGVLNKLPEHNEIVVGVEAGGSGQVHVSDFKIFYHSV
jgi:hypothetical protein